MKSNHKNPQYIYPVNMIIGCILLLALIVSITSVSLDMAANFSFRSGRSPHFEAESCHSFNDGQTNSDFTLSPVSGDTQTNRATFPSLFTAFHSFLVSYPKRIAVSPAKVHQVFLNFRGEQLRYNFVSHLSDAFQRHKIKFFIDKNEQRGKDLKDLFVRIEESRIALAIFSTKYAESSWCMDELVKMKKLADQGKLLVIPIFYKVEAKDVRKPTGDSEFGKNFWRLAEASNGDQIKEWKEALVSISDKMGLSLGEKRYSIFGSFESDFVKEIVKEMQRVIEAF
ncbi:Toll/interleukin-1 receptor homology (TIR) domain superfamily [Arabidopsis suecica]|uniref:Toll/interleukin-1 receptor homology (TIR) domain superfamily n=1 Tax=Arabidopsis suecica TaxID=45249 RepID=A0A8T1ZU60_ARASU|nr:Toll/interleukin-1 receptor homology (TIR) domain superfamily [Arabidopsis suecica]